MTEEWYLLAAPDATQAQIDEIRSVIEEAGGRIDTEAEVVIIGTKIEPISEERLQNC